jgi:Periplasmic protein involved in polysaccharide export
MEKIIRIIILFLCINGIAKYQTLDLNTLRLAQKQVTRSASAVSGIAKKGKNQDQFIIDRAVDSDKYIVGPGDQFHINIISSNETFDHSITISPSGKLLIPSVGIVESNQLTLTKLIKEINKQIRSWNKNVKINVELEVIDN